MKLIFLHAVKHEGSPQIDTMIFDWNGPAFPEFPKYQVCNDSTTSQKRSQR